MQPSDGHHQQDNLQGEPFGLHSKSSAQEVLGLSEMVLARGSKASAGSLTKRRASAKGKMLKGRHCEFIRLCNLPQCQNGEKFLVQVFMNIVYLQGAQFLTNQQPFLGIVPFSTVRATVVA